MLRDTARLLIFLRQFPGKVLWAEDFIAIVSEKRVVTVIPGTYKDMDYDQINAVIGAWLNYNLN